MCVALHRLCGGGVTMCWELEISAAGVRALGQHDRRCTQSRAIRHFKQMCARRQHTHTHTWGNIANISIFCTVSFGTETNEITAYHTGGQCANVCGLCDEYELARTRPQTFISPVFSYRCRCVCEICATFACSLCGGAYEFKHFVVVHVCVHVCNGNIYFDAHTQHIRTY